MNDYIIERLKPEDAKGVCRCMYRTYGKNYPSHDVYEAEKIKRLNASEEMISVVAKTKKGKVVGHYCIIIENIESKLGELGQAVVDPSHRNRGLMGKMRAFLEKQAVEKKLIGLYSAPVTSHIFSQKVNLAFGSGECCIDLGYVPQNVTFVNNIPGQKLSYRETIVVFFKYLVTDKPHQIYPPAKHTVIIKRIYKNLDIKRIFLKQKSNVKINDHTKFQYHVNTKWLCSWIGIFDYGKDFQLVLEKLLKEILSENIETIHIDLPLDNPLTPYYCNILEEHKFFFIGVIPNFLRSADAIRFQRVSFKKINFSSIKLYSDFAKKLLEYICMQQMLFSN